MNVEIQQLNGAFQKVSTLYYVQCLMASVVSKVLHYLGITIVGNEEMV